VLRRDNVLNKELVLTKVGRTSKNCVERQTLAGVNTASALLLCTCTSVVRLVLSIVSPLQVDVPISRSTLSAVRRSPLPQEWSYVPVESFSN